MPVVFRPAHGVRALLLAAAFGAGAAQAQFSMVPAPLPTGAAASHAESDAAYRVDAARHLYARYPMRLYKGRLPPLLYGVMVVETEVNAQGMVVDVRVRRPPSAPEVAPWVVSMIRRAEPYPPPARLGGAVYLDVWLVHRSGNFQLDTLTEGQD
jgi:hypothetical protein